MKLFIGVLFAAAILGGFAGGEISDTSFSIVGMIVGGVGTAAVLLGLSAYFDAQDKKSPDLPDEVRDVFDRMITGKKNPSPDQILKAKKEILQSKSVRPDPFKEVINALERLKPLYKSNNPYSMNAVDASFIAAKQSAKLDRKELQSDNRDPYDIALTTLWNISNQEVSCGSHHVYRGMLSDSGNGYLYVFQRTVSILLERGIIDQKEANENNSMIQKSIKAAG